MLNRLNIIAIGARRRGVSNNDPYRNWYSSETPELTTNPRDLDSIIVSHDDFTGETIDTDLWEITDSVDGVTISQNDALVFTIDRTKPVASVNPNSVSTKTPLTSEIVCVQFTVGGDATSLDGNFVASLYSTITPDYQAQILSLTTGADLRIRMNGVQVWNQYFGGLLLGTTFKMCFNKTTKEIKFFYRRDPFQFIQIGTTQIYDIEQGQGLKFRVGASSVSGTGTKTYTIDDFYITNETYETKNPEIYNPTISIIEDKLLIANQPLQDNRWYGRPVLKRISENVWMMVYANSGSHADLTLSQLLIRFSNDYGETWTDENKYLDGSSVVGFPMYAVGAAPGDNDHGPGDGWIIQCPDNPLHLLLHMWDSNYTDYYNGTWQSETFDGGKTWSIPAKITWINNTGITTENNRLLSSDQSFFYNNIIYLALREYELPTASLPSRGWFAKSIDNGASWELISTLSTFLNNTQEHGIEYVGGNTIVACIRGFAGPKAYYNKSLDMGISWEGISEVQDICDVWARQRVYTRSHIKGTKNWHNDPVLICNGYVHVNGEIGASHPRRLAVWISEDHGNTFIGPIYLKEEGYDGGYGDLLYNPVKDEYVTLQYYAPTSLVDGEIRQINWKLTI